jgi:hypothetical protein
MTVHWKFVENAVAILQKDDNVLGIAVGGSWIEQNMDEFSDIDLVLVTKEKISNDISNMKEYAASLGDFLSSFTGEHVGEPRLLVCLYDNPLLHVDIKFVTLDEFRQRAENPVIVWQRDNLLQEIIETTIPKFPFPDYQWLEDRFWIWLHYAAGKLGRGEYFELIEFLSYIRVNVLSPLLQIKNCRQPRGVRKIEMNFPQSELEELKSTIPDYKPESIAGCLENSVVLYKKLRIMFESEIKVNIRVEEKCIEYFNMIKGRASRDNMK